MEEELNLFEDNFEKEIQELETIPDDYLIKVQIDEELDNAVSLLNELKERYSENESATLLELCRDNVIDTITNQFGIASLIINSQDGGNVTTIHNAQQKIYASKKDEYNREVYEKGHYIPGENGKRGSWSGNSEGKTFSGNSKRSVGSEFTKSQIDEYGYLTDAYTNQKVKASATSPDHIESLSNFHKNGGYMLSDKEKCDFATDKNNLASTGRDINVSLKDKDKLKWEEEKSGCRDVTNAEYYGVDKEKLKEAVERGKETAQTHLPTNSQKAKYYVKNLAASGLADAGKMAAYSALGIIMRDLVSGIMTEVRLTFENRGKESFKEILARFKKRLSKILYDLKSKWKDILEGSFEAGIIAFMSNIVVFVINLFFTTLKKIVSMIRAGFVSLCQAVKILTNPPEGMSKEDVHYEAFKVLTAGIIGATSLGLSAAIEKGLQAIPGLQPLMMFHIPSFKKEPKTVSDVLSVILSSLAGGLITTIVLYFMDKSRAESKKDHLQVQLVTQSGVVVQCQTAKTWCTLEEAYKFFKQEINMGAEVIRNTKEDLTNSFAVVEEAAVKRKDAMAKLKALYKM